MIHDLSAQHTAAPHSRPIEARIDPVALRHNLSQLSARAPAARTWAVVKADAYGHGIANVFEGLRAADGFACLELPEAQTLRDLGWRGPILLLEGVFEARDLQWCSRLQLWHVVHCAQQLEWLAACKTSTPHCVYLKLNSGMNRLGFAPAHYRTAFARLQALPQVGAITHMTHFSDADAEPGIAAQLAVFETISSGLTGERCLPNSAAVLRHMPALHSKTDWVRLGIALYGSSPDYPAHHAQETRDGWGLLPTMTLHSRLIATQQLRAGDSVGYGSAYTAAAPMHIGVVACGYADGYPRHAGTNPQGAPILVNGARTRTVGRISMDMLCVDLTPIPDARVDSPVVLWGKEAGGAVLGIDEVAQAAQTIGYELMCAVAPRVPRVKGEC